MVQVNRYGRVRLVDDAAGLTHHVHRSGHATGLVVISVHEYQYNFLRYLSGHVHDFHQEPDRVLKGH